MERNQVGSPGAMWYAIVAAWGVGTALLASRFRALPDELPLVLVSLLEPQEGNPKYPESNPCAPRRFGMGRKREGVGRALQRALGTEFVLPQVEPREGGRSLLMNARRQRVFEYVWNHPCSHLRRISRELRIPPQSLRWHLMRLVEGRILATRAVKGKAVYYAPWAVREGDVLAFAALSNGMRGRIVRLVAQTPPISQSDIFRGLRTYQQAVLPSLGELTALGLLTSRKANGKRLYDVGATYERLLREYAEAAPERFERLVAVLQRDGVSPKVQTRTAEEAQVQVSNGLQKSVLRLRLAPAIR